MFEPELPPNEPTWVHTQERDINYWKQRLIAEEDESVRLHEEIERLEEENHVMRAWMWLNHGHKGMYGDDGEMQCGMCHEQYGFWDWKRTPLKEILDCMTKAQPWYVVKGKEAQDELLEKTQTEESERPAHLKREGKRGTYLPGA